MQHYGPVGGGGLDKLARLLLVIILAGFAAQVVLDTLTPLIPFITACVVVYIIVKVVWSSIRRW